MKRNMERVGEERRTRAYGKLEGVDTESSAKKGN